METLLNNLYNEFCVNGSVSCQKLYKANPQQNSITITLKFYDRNNELLNSKSIKFTNNQLSKSQQKLFKNISYKEIENNFLYARDYILSELISKNNDEIVRMKTENEGLQSMMNNKFVQSVITPKTNGNENHAKPNFSNMM